MFKSPKDFVIVHRDGSAQPDYIYPWNGRLAACITKSIIYSLGYLRHPRVKNALVSYAVGHSRFERNAWYKDPVYGYKDMNQVVSDFITYVSANFFLICIDSTINNPDCLGATANREWNGRFSARDYCISLNAARVGDMVAAATRAVHSRDRNDYDNKQFRTFLFIFTNTFFHETCHLFTTFLTQGRAVTPRHIGAQVKGYSKLNRGEFGRYMETVFFGGTLEYYIDPTRGVGQSGIPYIITKDGARRVSQHTIDASVDDNNIGNEIPIILGNQFIDTRTVQTLGAHLPAPVCTDPMNWKIMQQFKLFNHRDHVGTQSHLYGPRYHSGYPTQATDAGMPGRSGGRW